MGVEYVDLVDGMPATSTCRRSSLSFRCGHRGKDSHERAMGTWQILRRKPIVW